ncbi:MAG: VOC family protein [Gemmatimonadaceae bacterium]
MPTNTAVAIIGNHAKFTARPADRGRIRAFYKDVLGCTITRRSNEIDYFRLGDDFFFAAIYDAKVLPAEEAVKSVWLELKSHEPATLSERIRAFGVTELDTWEKGRLYFQAPGGQVFRVAGTDEDLSRFES